MKGNQIENLQIIRAVAALSVVLDHTFATSLKGLISDQHYEYIHSLFNNLGEFGVNVFFVLSGFLMVYTQKEEKGPYRFIYDRIIRIYPAYIIFSIPIIIYSFFPTKYDHQIDNVFQLIQNIILMPGWEGMSYTNANYPAWTLVYEMFFYFLFSGLLFLSRDKKKIAISISLILISMIAISKNIFHLKDSAQITDISYISSNVILLSFAAGCLLGWRFKKNSRNLNGSFFIATIIIIFITSPLLKANIILQDHKVISSIILGTLPATIIIFISLNTEEIKNTTMRIIGDASYTIYLTHVTLLFIKNKICSMLGVFDSIYLVILCNLIFIPIAIILGTALYRIIEKPIMDTLRKWGTSTRNIEDGYRTL